MNLEQLRATVNAGGVQKVTLEGKGDGFIVKITTIKGPEATLARVRGPEARCFINPRSGLGMLREAGVMQVMVDLTHWEPAPKK
ncbi:hypothetical protein GT347_10545 [Xylophilus rhododendri]|uniref:Uncharacterized protein n=1 Tax=Xylophilus rhododendri TaxID=2697032 RepID=A0A857J5A5_9BURK|nr:hypothetical protein [Xylophilus rhododendri]QHI98393.1 hypothetical protein GT347_10545 [Xylophilus rhododendri]